MTDSPVQSPIGKLHQEYATENFGSWSYQPSIDGPVLPYAKAVNYFNPFGTSVADMHLQHGKSAEAVFLSETGLSINNGNGLHVGIGIVNQADGHKVDLDRLKFELPMNLAEGMSGRQPPITSLYPRVTFPAYGSHEYAIVIIWDAEVFKNGLERFEVRIPQGSSARDVQIPLEIPCHDAIRKALTEFSGSPLLDQGKYSVSVEFERMPVACLRIDGSMPLHAKMIHERDIPFELPISNFQPSIGLDFLKISSYSGVAERFNPLDRRVSNNDKYVEVPAIVGAGGEEGSAVFNTASLEYRSAGEAKRDIASLTYVTLSRPESVAESAANPHLGLVEVQISSVAKVTSVNIDFSPERVERLRSGLSDIMRTPSADFDMSPLRGMFAVPMINTGRTELSKPRSAPVLPKAEAEWEKHLHTFRFCLTNEA